MMYKSFAALFPCLAVLMQGLEITTTWKKVSVNQNKRPAHKDWWLMRPLRAVSFVWLLVIASSGGGSEV
jgi:hypothetical protein